MTNLMQDMFDALSVVALTPQIRAYLMTNDPQALLQVEEARLRYDDDIDDTITEIRDRLEGDVDHSASYLVINNTDVSGLGHVIQFPGGDEELDQWIALRADDEDWAGFRSETGKTHRILSVEAAERMFPPIAD